MDTDLDTLATALYVTTDDLLPAHPEQVPDRPEVGFGVACQPDGTTPLPRAWDRLEV